MIENELDSKEQYANLKAQENPPTEAEIKKKVVERSEQALASRLCEYLTGMKPDLPGMPERLKTDQDILRAKYRLPPMNLPPAEFERALMQIAQDLGVKLRTESECGKFFEENPFAGAVHFED